MKKLCTTAVKIFILSIGFNMLLFAGNVSFADDVKMFNFYQIKYKVNDQFDIFVQPDMRFDDDIENYYYYHVRNGVVFHAHDNLDLGTTYRFARNKSSAGAWSNEHRLELDITPKVEVHGFKLSNRGRFEHRWLESAKDRWRYRNLAKIAYPASIGDFDFTPYISEEAFYDFEVDKMILNWATVGADKKITENLTVGLFYRTETARSGSTSEWNTRHVIGTKAMVSF